MFDFSWIITSIAIIGAIANAHRKRWGFTLWIVSNGYLCIYDFLLGLYSQSVLYFAFMLISVHGLIFWAKKPKRRTRYEQN